MQGSRRSFGSSRCTERVRMKVYRKTVENGRNMLVVYERVHALQTFPPDKRRPYETVVICGNELRQLSDGQAYYFPTERFPLSELLDVTHARTVNSDYPPKDCHFDPRFLGDMGKKLRMYGLECADSWDVVSHYFSNNRKENISRSPPEKLPLRKILIKRTSVAAGDNMHR